MKNIHHKFPELKLMSSNCLICLTVLNSPKTKYTFTVYFQERQETATNPLTCEAGTREFLEFVLKNYLNN